MHASHRIHSSQLQTGRPIEQANKAGDTALAFAVLFGKYFCSPWRAES
ncbi:hypothetical protein [Dyella psychrodurans]|nr:hypothetical protein [Dyella psychrodurans]